MDIADDDIELDRRVDELIERGLERFGRGDMEGALSQWKHALALDPDSERASNYLRYVEDHHDLGGDVAELNSESTVELAYPFGIAELGLAKLRDEDLDDYESFEILASGEPSVGEGDITKTVRIKSVASAVDDGWSVDEAWVEDLVNKSEAAFDPDLPEPVSEQVDEAHNSAAVQQSRRAPTSELSFADFELDVSGDEELEPTRAQISKEPLDDEIGLLDGGLASDEGPTMALRSPSQGLRKDLSPSGGVGRALDKALLREEGTIPGGAERGPGGRSALGSEAIAAMGASKGPAFGAREESTAERSGASAHGFDELELEALEPTNIRPEIPDALDDQTDSSIAISFYGDETAENVLDEELTIDRGGLSAAGLVAGAQGPGEDSGLLDIPMAPQSSHHQTLEETREIPLSLDFSLREETAVPTKTVDLESGGIDIGLSGDELASLDIGSPSTGDLLAQVCAAAPDGDENERTQFIVGRLIDSAGDEYMDGNNARAAIAIGHALDRADDSAVAQKIIFENERRIVEILLSSLGELDQVPRLVIPMMEIPLDQIDHRVAFLLTRVDGTLTLDEILDVSGMPRMEALRHLSRLHAKSFLEVR